MKTKTTDYKDRRIAVNLAKALYHLDIAGAYATGTSEARALIPLRVRLSRLFNASGFEFGENAPGVRKRRQETNTELTDSQLDAAGKRLAEVFSLKRDREHKGRWCTGWGTYTNRGLALVVLESADRIQCGEVNP